MILAVLLLAQALPQVQPIDIFSDRYSVQTKKRYEAYARCFAKGAYERRRAAGSPEAHMREAKAACGAEYDSFVAGVVKDSEGSPDTASAARNARAFLDEMDARALVGPPAPAKLANLPVERLVGNWRLGGGPLAVDMNVEFVADGSLVGTMKSDTELTAHGLKSWKVIGDGTNEAVFFASFTNGKEAKYHRVPSFPGEMTFINSAETAIQRFDIAIKDYDLILSMVTPELGRRLRFRRQIGTTPGSK